MKSTNARTFSQRKRTRNSGIGFGTDRENGAIKQSFFGCAAEKAAIWQGAIWQGAIWQGMTPLPSTDIPI
jgi:hypothetical protein